MDRIHVAPPRRHRTGVDAGRAPWLLICRRAVRGKLHDGSDGVLHGVGQLPDAGGDGVGVERTHEVAAHMCVHLRWLAQQRPPLVPLNPTDHVPL